MTKGCIEWSGYRNATGYGQVGSSKYYTRYAHRVTFFECNGWWPEVVMHACDNPPCVNPEHLVGGTQKDNLHDMARKGRKARGSFVLTDSDIVAILADSRSCVAIAKDYGVGKSTVHRVKKGEAVHGR